MHLFECTFRSRTLFLIVARETPYGARARSSATLKIFATRTRYRNAIHDRSSRSIVTHRSTQLSNAIDSSIATLKRESRLNIRVTPVNRHYRVREIIGGNVAFRILLWNVRYCRSWNRIRAIKIPKDNRIRARRPAISRIKNDRNVVTVGSLLNLISGAGIARGRERRTPGGGGAGGRPVHDKGRQGISVN